MNTQIQGIVLAAGLSAGCACGSAAAAHDAAKSPFDRAEHLAPAWTANLGYAAPLAPDGTTASPLTLDPIFNGSGTAYGDGNDTHGNLDVNLRVFSSLGGYWLVGYHNDDGGGAYYGFVISYKNDGTRYTNFGTDGMLKAVLPFYPVDVANPPGTNKFYFTGPYRGSPTADYDFGVYCLDGGTGNPCTGFGNNGVGLSVTAIDRNGFHDDFPVRIVASGDALYIAGTSDTLGGLGDLDVSLAAISQATGDVLPGFGNNPDNPGTSVFPINFRTHGVDRSIDLLVNSSASLPGGHRIYIVGETQRGADNDTDGFILAADLASGDRDTTFNGSGLRPIYADLGATNKEDEVDAVAQTREGELIIAGTSKDDEGNQELLLAKVHPDGSADASFCGHGSCAGVRVLSAYEVPVGIAERTGNRDLVIGMNIHADFAGDGHVMEALLQLGSSGNATHALTVVDIVGVGDVTLGSRAASLLVDFSNRVLLGGTRTYDTVTQDYDMLITRTVDTDTIFANWFELVQ